MNDDELARAFEIIRTEQFKDAAADLLVQFGRDRGIAIAGEWARFLLMMSRGGSQEISTLAAACWNVVYRHLTIGSPLAFPPVYSWQPKQP
jgi:hypothetical protein